MDSNPSGRKRGSKALSQVLRVRLGLIAVSFSHCRYIGSGQSFRDISYRIHIYNRLIISLLIHLKYLDIIWLFLGERY